MINGVQEEVGGKEGGGVSDVRTAYIPAPNIIEDGMCKSCEENVVIATHAIECWECRNMFHAIECNKEEYNVCSKSVFTSAIIPAVTKKKGFTSKFGTFLWLCNFCSTETEKRRGATVNDRVSILDKKIENLNSNFQTELKEMKNMLLSLTKASDTAKNSQDRPVMETKTDGPKAHENIWHDVNRTKNLTQKFVIKSVGGKPVDSMLLEKACVDNNVPVFTSRKINNSEDMAIVVKSQKDADTLQKHLPGHVFEKIDTNTPKIVVTGLCRSYDKIELVNYIKSQNEGIKTLFECNDVSEEDKKLEVIYITSIRSNNNVFRATVKVSNVIRSIIAKQGDRLFIGSQPVCKAHIQNRARQQGILGGNFGIGRKFWNLGGNFRTLKC
jgi:hypothetical protein